MDEKYAWIQRLCMESHEAAPAQLLEELMASSECVAFGPVHHFLVPATLLTCLRNAQGGLAREHLEADLEEAAERASQIPGGVCARWGICGAAIGTGIAYAVANDNAPLKRSGWTQNQLMVSRIAHKIALSGEARCCKRDSRIAVRLATPELARTFNAPLVVCEPPITCAASQKNTVCSGVSCPFH